jgi:hypothetical protein
MVGRGVSSPKKEDYPAYVENGGESARGLHAIRVLENKKDFTLDSLLAAAYDTYLTWFDKPLPALINAWDETPASSPLKAKVAAQIDALRKWDHRWAVDSVPTSLAIFWATDLQRRLRREGLGTDASGAPTAPLSRRLPRHPECSRRDAARISGSGQRQARCRLRQVADSLG